MAAQEPSPAGRYRMFRNSLVETLPDGRYIDPFLMRIIHHHADTEADRADLLELCSVAGTRLDHLRVLLRHVGAGRPTKMDSLSVSTWQIDKMVTCTFSIRSGILRWGENTLSGTMETLPDTVLTALPGRPLRDLITHPYFPEDLIIAEVRQEPGRRWLVKFEAPDGTRLRQQRRKKHKEVVEA